jgi:hypothetical protein
MKKVLIALGIIFLVVVAYVFIGGLFISKDFHFERSITINAPKEIVWENVSKFSNFQKWNPFSLHDPHMESKIEGTDGTVGAVYRWKGNKDVGSGTQTYKALNPYSHVGIDLQFMEPYESKANAFINLEPEGKAQKVTWGFDSETPYPMNAVMPFINMEKMMDADFSLGLENLKQLCEAGMSETL